MVLLPIATRELRVASRRRITFHVRLGMALGAALLAFGLLAFTDVTRSDATGKALFAVLSWAAFGFALLAGVFLAADAISEEKREGTLGLLFLTDLGGFDVVAGKFLIVGLNAFLALATVLPVMGLGWLLGGVTEGEYWRVALALLNTLFISLSIGLAVSSLTREQARALTATFLVLLGLTATLGLLPVLTRGGPLPFGLAWLAGWSPLAAFRGAADLAYRADAKAFWLGLAGGQFVAWLALGLATWGAARRWRDQPEGNRRAAVASLRRDLLDENPVTALVAADRQLRGQIWAVALGVLLCLLLNAAVGKGPILPAFYVPWARSGLTSFATVVLAGVVLALLVLLKMMFAWHACHFFAQSRRHGALDAVLSTPLSDEEILGGVWSALRRLFLKPLLLIGAALTMGPILQSAWLHSVPGTTGPVFDAEHVGAWGLWLYTLVSLPLELIAIAWLGVWLALTDRRPTWAFAKTMGFAVLLPVLLFCVPNLLLAGVLYSFARARMDPPLRALLEGPTVQWRRLT